MQMHLVIKHTFSLVNSSPQAVLALLLLDRLYLYVSHQQVSKHHSRPVKDALFAAISPLFLLFKQFLLELLIPAIYDWLRLRIFHSLSGICSLVCNTLSVIQRRLRDCAGHVLSQEFEDVFLPPLQVKPRNVLNVKFLVILFYLLFNILIIYFKNTNLPLGVFEKENYLNCATFVFSNTRIH